MGNVVILGAGFSGLSAACYLAREGHRVTVLEKNPTIGGRARQFERDGFRFDMGPTFYWMPDVFERFFADFGRSPSDFYHIERLDPGYEIYFGKNESIRQPAALDALVDTFESLEPGSGRFLESFLRKAGYNYRVAMDRVVYKPGRSPFELVMPQTAARSGQFLSSLSSVVRKGVRDPRLRQMLEFPVLFLGAKAADIPSFYRFMNYADMALGSWHVEGGMIRVAEGMKSLAESMGVEVRTSCEADRIAVRNRSVSGVLSKGTLFQADTVISSADYQHTESLLESEFRNYTRNYWESRVMAPSAVLFYIGFGRRLENVSHHTLFFDAGFDEHAHRIYDKPSWPERPLFYASFPTKSDSSLGPSGKETAIVLIPSASGLVENRTVKERYFRQVIRRMEEMSGQRLEDDVEFCESYAMSDFRRDYNAFKGNAYGLANTLMQTAFMKPKMYNRKLPNLFYAGQLTVPGPGVPTALISGKIAAEGASAYLRKRDKMRTSMPV